MKAMGSALLVVLLLAGMPCGADPSALRASLHRALAMEPGARVVWGALVKASDGTVVFATNEHRAFVPASNTKLFTAALALDRLGAAHRLRSPLLAAGRPDAVGVLRSDLWLMGRGDPRFGADPTNRVFADALLPLAELLRRQGLRSLEGDLVLCDAGLRTPAAGPGWDPEDLVEWYGAPVSAFVVNDNTFRLVAAPAARSGAPATWHVEPALPGIRVDWRVTTSTNRTRAVEYFRPPATNAVRFAGRLPLGARAWTPEIAVADAPAYFGELLLGSMRRSGIAVSGTVRVVHTTNGAPAEEFAAWESAPLAGRLADCMKPSQNLHAQLLLAVVGRDAGGDAAGTDDARGLSLLPALLERAGIATDAVRLEEGSGLSRGNAVTPSAAVALLRHMRGHADSAAWMASLPVAGLDGTLKSRFREGPARGRVRAKTGTLRGVHALSGYVTTAAGEELVFSVFANDAARDPGARNRMDLLVEILAAHSGRLAAR